MTTAVRNRVLRLARVRASDLVPHPRNWRAHPEKQAAALRGILAEIGYADALLARELPDGRLQLVDGHLRAETTPDFEVPVLVLDLTEAEADKLLLSLDPLAAMAEANAEALESLLRDVATDDDALRGLYDDLSAEWGVDGGDADGMPGQPPGSRLANRFGVAPFSVLNAREGWWQGRKSAWLSMGIRSERGRGADVVAEDRQETHGTGGLLMKSWTSHPAFYRQKQQKEREIGRTLTTAEFEKRYWIPPTDDAYSSGTSVFDPVLCELVYRWFSPEGGVVLDPFAGGSVRGIVASHCARRYVGVDLRPEQVAANGEQRGIAVDPLPEWRCGDSRRIASVCPDVRADLVFSCPPYADLERYSDDAADLSTLDYDEFLAAYREIIAAACGLLREDRFACFVVGDVRDKAGNYRNFVGDTVEAFRSAGLHFYNEAILVTAIGSLPIRVGKQFTTSRKLGKTHQNVLVFVKGDGRRAADACGACDFGAADGPGVDPVGEARL